MLTRSSAWTSVPSAFPKSAADGQKILFHRSKVIRDNRTLSLVPKAKSAQTGHRARNMNALLPPAGDSTLKVTMTQKTKNLRTFKY